MTMLESINSTLAAELARDERVMVLGQDVGRNGGVFRVTDGLFDRFGGDRVFDTPLSETAIVGASIGLALGGMVPVAELQFLAFGYEAFHQIAGQLARYRHRSAGRFTCPVTLRAPFGGGVRAPELHSDALEALFAHTPGLKVVLPATAADAKGLLTSAIRDPDPVMFLEPIRGYRSARDDVPDGEHLVPFGQLRVAREGTDVTVLAWSHMVSVAQRAAERVQVEDGISAHVIDVRTLVPLDVDGIAAAVARTGRAVVAQEAALTGGFAAEVVATIQEEVFDSLEAPVRRVAGYDTPYPAGPLEGHYVPDEDRLVAALRSTVAWS